MDRIDRQETAETVFDGITCQMLLYNDIDGVFRLEVDPETGEASYDTEGYTTLRELFSGGMSKKAAVQVLKSLMSVWVGLDEYMIPRNELLMGLSDVYVKDDKETVYNIEMQTTSAGELPKRSRYYQGMIDLQLLDKNESYKKLNKSYIILYA